MSVEELADQLKTSEITIRRDLDYFESKKLIDRHRGGATLNKNNFTTNIFSSNLAINKHAIAKAASQLCRRWRYHFHQYQFDSFIHA
jgi:DeoR/GlpR family transcriptional regulator of sugar metabolism